MKCLNCDATLGQDDVFCGECGQKIERTAPEQSVSAATIQKVAPPAATAALAIDNPKRSKSQKEITAQAPATRSRFRAFFIGGATFTGLTLVGFLLSLAMPDVVNGAIFLIIPSAFALLALILVTILKHVSIGSALISLLGALAAFVSLGVISASGPEPGPGGIAMIFILAFLAFLIPAFIFRKR